MTQLMLLKIPNPLLQVHIRRITTRHGIRLTFMNRVIHQ